VAHVGFRGLDVVKEDFTFSLSMKGVQQMQVNIKNLIDDTQCYDTVRKLRWPEGRDCPFCESRRVIRRGFDEKESAKQRYECKKCGKKGKEVSW